MILRVGRSPHWLILAVAIVVVLLSVAPRHAHAQTPPEFRAMWVDCVVGHPGLFSQAQIDKLLGVPGDPDSLGDLREANCNAAIIEVRRAGQVIYDSALDEPWLTSFDALAAVLAAAHDTTGGKKRIEVHAWIVTFLTGGGTIWDAHRDVNNPDNYWPTLTYDGATSSYGWDPGHPKVQKYIVDVMMDLVNNYDVDGVHYDYIRFTGGSEGYNPTSIARYNARYGTTGKPGTTDDRFDQWRRDQITGIVRQVYARVQAVKPQVLQSGSFVTWNPSPTASTRAAFQATRPYGNRSDGVFSDWDAWMEEGIMDFGVPMNYYDEQSLPADYDRWLNFIKDRKFNRHMINGPGLYKNYLENGDVINQLLATRDQSPNGNYANGFCGFSYFAPYVITKPTGYGNWDTFEPVFRAQVTPTWADIPDRPWKSAPTKGHISGSVTIQGTGAWADGATVSIAPDPRPAPYNVPMVCDGTGFYAFIDVPPGTYTLTASMPGYVNANAQANVQIGSVTGNMYVRDMQLSIASVPVISNVQATELTTTSAVITWDTNVLADSTVNYGLTSSYDLSATDATAKTSHSVLLTGLTENTTYHYQCVSTNAYGTDTTTDYTFTTALPLTEVVVDNLDPGWASTGTGSWSVGSNPSVPKIGTDYLYYAGETSPTRKCTWTPLLTQGGYYDVYAFYQMGTNRNTAAPYTLHYDGGQITSIQNQNSGTANQGGWFLIAADKPFLAGTSGYLELTNQSSDTKYVSADAAKWVFKAPFDTTPPTISISAPSASLTRSGPVTYTITYEGADSVTLASGDVTLNKTGTANGSAVVSGSGTATRTVTISGLTGTGTIGISIAAGTASDNAGNLALAAGPSAAFGVDNSAPVISLVTVNPSMAAIGDSISVVVDVSDESAITGVTANLSPLAASVGTTWAGTLTAMAPWAFYPVEVVVTDAAGNTSTDTSAGYKTAQLLAASTEAASRPAMVAAKQLFVFKFAGKVTELSDDYFALDDGSGPVTVHAIGYKAMVRTGDCAIARGFLSFAGSLESVLALIVKY